MKILVITFSRGLNPGTFMQAYGVRTGLLKIFPNAEINYLSFPDFKWDKGKRGKKDFIGHVLLQKAFAVEIQKTGATSIFLYAYDRLI